VVDEVGYFGTGSETGRYTSLTTAKRVLDTRTTTGGHHSTLAPGKGVTVHPAVPADATAAVVDVTTTGAKSGGHVSAAPTCSDTSSTLNFAKYSRANLAAVGLTSAGTFCIVDGVAAVNVIVDVVGYIGADGAQYVALPSGYRIVDTRNGNGGSAGQHSSRALTAKAHANFYGANVGDVPADAVALLTGAVVASATAASGYLTLYPGTTPPTALTSNVNFTSGRVVSNAAVVPLSSSHNYGIYNSAGSTHVAVDVFGYFE
jgi:hypothetical protein